MHNIALGSDPAAVTFSRHGHKLIPQCRVHSDTVCLCKVVSPSSFIAEIPAERQETSKHHENASLYEGDKIG